MRFSKRSDWPSGANALSQKQSEKKAKKRQILDLTQSNPTQCGFRYPEKKILAALSSPLNLHYEPASKGLLAARQAVCRYYAAKKIKVDPERIFLTASTSEAYAFVLRLLCNPGEAILSAHPSYPLLEYLTSLSDVELVPYKLSLEEKHWGIDWPSVKENIDRVKALVLVNPNNPTGHFISKEEKEKLSTVCATSDTPLIIDEVFLDFELKKKKEAAGSFANNEKALTFTLSGISKILALPQMKLSWIVVSGPEAQAREAVSRLEIIADTYLSVNTPSQRALSSWLASSSFLRREIVQRLAFNFRQLSEALSKNKNISVLDCEGGWYAVVQLNQSHLDDEALAIGLLEEQDVLVHPGYFFDFDSSHFLVLSLLTKPDIFKKGVQRLSRVLHSFS